ncbi:hypothetical protein IWQ60_012192, partial [Tieghemiomyces parasiticus]
MATCISYEDIIARWGIKDKEKSLSALHSLLPVYKGQHPTFPAFVYVQGIDRQPVGKLKEALKAVHFKTSRILNVAFVGNATAEFRIHADHLCGLKAAIADVGEHNGWTILPAFNGLQVVDTKAPAALVAR